MLWDDLTEEQQLACYISYVEEFKNEWGDYAQPLSFDEFSYEWSGSIYWYIWPSKTFL